MEQVKNAVIRSCNYRHLCRFVCGDRTFNQTSVVTVGGVAFWPAAVIPAIFAVLFGPWTGGIGAAIGIFIRDMLFHGDPLLSLSAGVTANFAVFFIIGYVSRTNLDRKKLSISAIIGSIIIVAGLLLPTVLLPTESRFSRDYQLQKLSSCLS